MNKAEKTEARAMESETVLLVTEKETQNSRCMKTKCCSVLQCVAVCCCVLQCVAVCCSVLQCVAVCCSVNGRCMKTKFDDSVFFFWGIRGPNSGRWKARQPRS